MLQLNPAHAVEIAKRPAWEMIFLWLLITDDTPVATPDLTYHKDNNENDHTEDPFADGFEVVSLSLSTPKNGDDTKNADDDDKERLLNTIVELMGLIVWEEAIDVIVTDELYLKHVRFVFCLSSNLFFDVAVFLFLGLVSTLHCSKRFC